MDEQNTDFKFERPDPPATPDVPVTSASRPASKLPKNMTVEDALEIIAVITALGFFIGLVFGFIFGFIASFVSYSIIGSTAIFYLLLIMMSSYFMYTYEIFQKIKEKVKNN